MTVYNSFRKSRPEWPEFLREVVGRRVRLRHQLETRSGTVFEKDEVLIVSGTWRGKVRLLDNKDPSRPKSIAWIYLREVELLRHESIIWRSKEALLLFCIAVAGKNGRQTQARVEKFLESCVCGDEDYSPFIYIRNLINGRNLRRELKRLRFGQYTKLVRAFTEVIEADLDLDHCRTRELERIHGIGPKTSRFFIMRTRPAANVAALDTHILRWLRDLGHDNIPKSTPQSSMAYYRVESIFLAEAKKRRKRPAQLDAEIWDEYSGHGTGRGEKDQVASFA